MQFISAPAFLGSYPKRAGWVKHRHGQSRERSVFLEFFLFCGNRKNSAESLLNHQVKTKSQSWHSCGGSSDISQGELVRKLLGEDRPEPDSCFSYVNHCLSGYYVAAIANGLGSWRFTNEQD